MLSRDGTTIVGTFACSNIFACYRAISLDPAFKKAWMRRGMVRHSRGKYAGSVADFTEALLLDPNDKHAKKLLEHSAAKEREVS